MKIDGSLVNPINNTINQNTSTANNNDFEKILEKAKTSGDTDQLRKACSDLESVFVNMIMKSMRSTVTEDEGIFKKSESEKMFEGMLDEKMSSKIADAGGIGIGDMLFDQMSKYLYNDEDAVKKVSSFEMKG